jgi:hypothetical protein
MMINARRVRLFQQRITSILSPKNQVLYATRAGELADAGNMGESGIYEFFKKVTPGLRTKSCVCLLAA